MQDASCEMTRREALKTLGVGAASAAFGSTPLLAAEKEKHNVLFVAVDDLNTHLGCYGNKVVKSPNIDRLAQRGIVFERAYCQAVICGPTRASMFTGFRPDATGVFDNYTKFQDKLPNVVTMPRLFRDNGYTALRVGKAFHSKIGDPDAWSRWRLRREFPKPSKKEQDLREAQTPGERMFRFGATDNEDAAEKDGMRARQAVQALRELKDTPFFMGLGLARPHEPFVAPKKYCDMYDPSDIEVRTGPHGPAADSNFHRHFRPYMKRDLTMRDAQEIVAAYYAGLTFMDAQLGLVLDELDRLKLAEKTIVVLWGDHGYLLGEHWRWAKHALYEETCRVPLIMAGPGIRHPEPPCESIVECVDVYPTLAEACRLPIQPGLQGVSLMPLIQNPTRTWKQCAFTQHLEGSARSRSRRALGTSIRTARYRYTDWAGQKEAVLYDHEGDPYEYKNVAKDPAYAKAVMELQELLAGGWEAALPAKQ